MRLRQIRNATLVIEYAGGRLLVDPWLEEKGTGMLAPSPWPENNEHRSPLVDLPCPVGEVLTGVDAVVVTHVHPDHFEEKTAALMDHALPVYAQNEADAAAIVWASRCSSLPTARCSSSERYPPREERRQLVLGAIRARTLRSVGGL